MRKSSSGRSRIFIISSRLFSFFFCFVWLALNNQPDHSRQSSTRFVTFTAHGYFSARFTFFTFFIFLFLFLFHLIIPYLRLLSFSGVPVSVISLVKSLLFALHQILFPVKFWELVFGANNVEWDLLDSWY